MMQAVAQRHEVVGIDLVEVAPDYDPTGSTSILAAQICSIHSDLSSTLKVELWTGSF